MIDTSPMEILKFPEGDDAPELLEAFHNQIRVEYEALGFGDWGPYSLIDTGRLYDEATGGVQMRGGGNLYWFKIPTPYSGYVGNYQRAKFDFPNPERMADALAGGLVEHYFGRFNG